MIEFEMTSKNVAQKKHTEGCLICGKELIYAAENKTLSCIYCGKEQVSNMFCPDGHFVCNECHGADALEIIKTVTARSTETNPIELARELMNTPVFNMHGPEHHVLVTMVILTCLKNLGVEISDKQLNDAMVRSRKLPGGICGNWGACGAALGSGIALSVLKGLTSLHGKAWGETNYQTGEILQRVSAHGGPRCCKRTTYSSLLALIDILEREKVTNFPEQAHVNPVCHYFSRNQQCIRLACPYFPKSSSDKQVNVKSI